MFSLYIKSILIFSRFLRSTEDGELGEPVPGIFYSTGLCALSFSIIILLLILFRGKDLCACFAKSY